MKRGLVFEGLLRFMDQQRRNNFYFFQACSSTPKQSSMASIPFENLGTLEVGGQTGNVGKEIYGADESLWMYLMFEALGKVSDRELMLVNVDLLDATHKKEFPSQKLNFVRLVQSHSHCPVGKHQDSPGKRATGSIACKWQSQRRIIARPETVFHQANGRVLIVH